VSVVARALGNDFARLHPQLQRRFGFDSSDRIGCIGTGVMDVIWHRSAGTIPFLALGGTRNELVPEAGYRVPFILENYAYVDGYGREALTFVPTFEFEGHRRRRFDATMVYHAGRGTIVDYLGTHQQLAVDLAMAVDDRGGLRIHGGSTRVGRVRCPSALTGAVEVHEWYSERSHQFRIQLKVTSPVVGPLFGYRGRFTVSYVDTRQAPVPATVKPLRENRDD
jgi:hypothetical protein